MKLCLWIICFYTPRTYYNSGIKEDTNLCLKFLSGYISIYLSICSLKFFLPCLLLMRGFYNTDSTERNVKHIKHIRKRVYLYFTCSNQKLLKCLSLFLWGRRQVQQRLSCLGKLVIMTSRNPTAYYTPQMEPAPRGWGRHRWGHGERKEAAEERDSESPTQDRLCKDCQA